MHEPRHRGLTADMFVLRSGRFLTLTRTAELGNGVEYLPGGGVDRGEDPRDAAIRETEEETGLTVSGVQLLRVWTYPTPEGWDTVHATYYGTSDGSEPTLSNEHSAFQWTTPRAYIDKWCSEEIEAALPTHRGWLRAVRTNCELLARVLDEQQQ